MLRLAFMKKRGKQKKIDAKGVFERYLAPKMIGRDSEETIAIFCTLDYNHFYDIATKYGLKERQISSLVGFKDEFFVLTLICQIISERQLDNVFYSKKVTANRSSGLHARKVHQNGKDITLMLGGDCVIFRKRDDKPLLIIECKEYIDMIRLKEVIGESRLVKDDITESTNLLGEVRFCIFAEVLELTEGWGALLRNSNLRYKIDEIFIVRNGKRRDKENRPVKATLTKFKNFIIRFLESAK